MLADAVFHEQEITIVTFAHKTHGKVRFIFQRGAMFTESREYEYLRSYGVRVLPIAKEYGIHQSMTSRSPLYETSIPRGTLEADGKRASI